MKYKNLNKRQETLVERLVENLQDLQEEDVELFFDYAKEKLSFVNGENDDKKNGNRIVIADNNNYEYDDFNSINIKDCTKSIGFSPRYINGEKQELRLYNPQEPEI